MAFATQTRTCGDYGHKSKRTGEPCGAVLRRDAIACKWHGGNSPRARAAEARRGAEREAQRALADLDAPAVADPLTALSEIAGQVVAFKDAMADRVNALNTIRYEDAKGAEQLRAEVAVFERALDRCERFLTAMAKLNIEERLVALDERRAELVAGALGATLAELGLTDQQQQEAKTRVARHLRLVAG